MKLKIAVVQMNPIVGDIEGNARKIETEYGRAMAEGADLVVFPECALSGYPLEDLVLRQSFVDAVVGRSKQIIDSLYENRHATSPAIIYGTPLWTPEGPANGAIFFDPMSGVSHMIQKVELPNYGVFDEKRVFTARPQRPSVISFRGHNLGLMICEDCWFPRVTKELVDQNAHFLIAINGSPFEVGKDVIRKRVVRERVEQSGLPFLYVNLVGGQDELVFDGGSFLYDGTFQQAPFFTEGVAYFDTQVRKVDRHFEDGEVIGIVNDVGDFVRWTRKPRPLINVGAFPQSPSLDQGAIYRAAVLGLHDYMGKQGFRRVILGYSGGVDSGLVAAIACDALGADNVHLVRLPSKFSSQHSLDDAAAGAERLGAKMRTILIEPVVDALRAAYAGSVEGQSGVLTGVADENIQARARGNILMAISNQESMMVLTTGNKSEVSVGYATLYGDMSGGFNPIKDMYKTTVWDLCRWRNRLTGVELERFGFLGRAAEVVPEEIISKPPSAELRPDQKDEDSLPPYPVLDAILKGMIERERSVAELIAEGIADEPTIRRVRSLLDNAEYKRRQAAPA
jgi:NAD+ synthase